MVLAGLKYLSSQWRAILICCFITMGAFQFGFDTSYFSGILSMKPFIAVFGSYNSTTSSYDLSASRESLITSVINIGELLGAVSSSFVGDRLGRKGGLYVSSTCVIIGTTLQVASTEIGALIAGRIVVGFAVGLISCLVPLYIADCAPARLRGALVTMYQFTIGMGLLLGIIVDQQTSTRRDTGAYRIPMAVQFVFPIILVPGLLLFAPESPRWLLEKNKDAKATRALRKLIGPNHEDEIILETESIQQTIETYEYGSSSWESVFKWGPEGRKAYLGASLQAFQQASGINFITSYGVVFFFAVGIDSVYLVQLGLYIVGIPAIWISQYCIEKFGRRPLLIVSGILMITALFIMGGCGLVTDKSRSVDSTIVAMVYIFIFVFNIGWGPAVWVVTSEISTGGNRGKLMSISTASNWFFTWMVTFTFPYLDNANAANLGPKIGFLYGALMIFACVWVYFYLPETAGRSLEEIHTLFQLGVPARQFKCYELPSVQRTMIEKEDEKVIQMTQFSVEHIP